MKQKQILLENVNLYYSSVAFKERSLKTLLVKLPVLRRQRHEIHDIHALKNISV